MLVESRTRPHAQSELLVEPRARFLEYGQLIHTPVKSVDGKFSFNAAFRIQEKLGEGFAGQVYRVIDENTNATYALKALRPEKQGKEKIRDVFFRLCFGANFAPAIDENALRYGLIWQKLLKRGAEIQLPQGETAIPEPIGYVWIDKLGAFAEIQEFIKGSTPPPHDGKKNQQKRAFMDNIVTLANNMGAYQVARQYKWWTLLAGANVMERDDGSHVAVDWRSGIALPFFLPLSPGDIPIIIDNLKRGQFVNFDYANFERLDNFVQQHKEQFADFFLLVEEVKQLDERYRRGARYATIAEWERDGKIDEQTAETLRQNTLLYRAYLLNEQIPIIGKAVHRAVYSDLYREHVGTIISDPEYRSLWLKTMQQRDTENWHHQRRITAKKAKELQEKPWLFALHKTFFSHVPRQVQKATDDDYLREKINAGLRPLRIALSKKEQQQWIIEKIQEGVDLKLLTDDLAQQLLQQTKERKMRQYIQELAVITPLLEIASLGVYPAALALTRDPLIPALMAVSPITPSGVLRTVYTTLRGITEIPQAITEKNVKNLKTRAVGAIVAPWTKVGILFIPVQMAAYYPEMASFLTALGAVKITEKIPVYGVRGGAIEHLVYEASQKLLPK